MVAGRGERRVDGDRPAIPRLHPDELPADVASVRRLVATHAPRWAKLDVAPVASCGTDHWLFRLGEELVARLPRRPSAVGQAAKEARWLPALAPRLTLPIPVPLAHFPADDAFPAAWSVVPWLAGAPAHETPPADLGEAAGTLAAFVRALRAADAIDGPRPGAHNFGRGEPLAARVGATHEALARTRALGVDADAAEDAWRDALAAPAWDGAPAWLHGDLGPRNLLVREGRLAAALDFGGLGVGDPACDLLPAWNLLDAPARARFRAEVDVDGATWRRGRDWAATTALVALP